MSSKSDYDSRDIRGMVMKYICPTADASVGWISVRRSGGARRA